MVDGIIFREDQIHRKDGSGSIDVVRGRIADETGTIQVPVMGEPFSHEIGWPCQNRRSSGKTFRDTPELNFGGPQKLNHTMTLILPM